MIGGGQNNLIQGSAPFAMISGGLSNVVAGAFGFAASKGAQALHIGSFVWGGNIPNSVTSSAPSQVVFQASGGVHFFTSPALMSGVTLDPGSGGWETDSDRNKKENFGAVDGREVLEKVAAVPVLRWNMKTQDPSIRHIGPMAQDFHEAFFCGWARRPADQLRGRRWRGPGGDAGVESSVGGSVAGEGRTDCSVRGHSGRVEGNDQALAKP